MLFSIISKDNETYIEKCIYISNGMMIANISSEHEAAFHNIFESAFFELVSFNFIFTIFIFFIRN